MAYRIVLIFIVTLGAVMTGSGQIAQIKERNTKYLESIRKEVEASFCQGNPVYLVRYKKKEVKRVISALKWLNSLVERDVTPGQLDSAVSRINFGKVDEANDLNGSLRTVTVNILLNYLSVTLKYGYIDQIIITKKIKLTPRTKVECATFQHGLVDFKILSDIYVKNIEYPIRLVDYGYLLMKKINTDNLVKVSAGHKK